MSTSPAPAPVIDVGSWQAVEPESAGGDEKVWLGGEDGRPWLFKPRTEHSGWSQGEDWAEKITTEVARVLGIPAAVVQLAAREGRRGTISHDVTPDGWELQHGSLLISEVAIDFEICGKSRRHHNLETIRQVLEAVDPPPGHADLTAFGVFSGYLVLDALVANSDRHEENWALLRPSAGQGPAQLAPSYDHGSSLGFNLKDTKRELEIGRNGIPAWAGRARAQRFDQTNDGRLSLADLAHRALDLSPAAARQKWLPAVSGLTDAHIDTIVGSIPGLSEATRTFVCQLLLINRERLLR